MKKIIWLTLFLFCLSLASALEPQIINSHNILSQTTVQKINNLIGQSTIKEGKFVLEAAPDFSSLQFTKKFNQETGPLIYIIYRSDSSLALFSLKGFPLKQNQFMPGDFAIGGHQQKLVDLVKKTIGLLEGKKEKAVQIIEENKKDMSKYTDKTVFLVSDENWQDVLSLVPAAIWGGHENCHNLNNQDQLIKNPICAYPLLIYHKEKNYFDVDSIIFFMQQYNAEQVVIVGQNNYLHKLLVAEKPVGGGIREDKIKSISPTDFVLFWQSFDKVVYVENDYSLAMMASVYASLINAPLIIERGPLDKNDNLAGRKVICVGNVRTRCDKKYSLEALQKKYLAETNTNKLLIINSNDLNIEVTERISTEKSGHPLNKLYGKTSLAAAILASAKQEIILNAPSVNYMEIDRFIETSIANLGISPKYLTIMASPIAIQMYKTPENPRNIVMIIPPQYRHIKLFEEIDNHIYGNLDADTFQELAVGRIFSLTSSDISSYLARDLFYSELTKNKEFSVLWPPPPKGILNYKPQGIMINNLIQAMGFTSVSLIGDEPEPSVKTNNWPDILSVTEKFFKNKDLIIYLDHGSQIGGDFYFDSYRMQYTKTWLSSPLIIFQGCLSCSFESANPKSSLFCANLIRRGAILQYGAAVGLSFDVVDSERIIVEELMRGHDIGSAVKSIKNQITANQKAVNKGQPFKRTEYESFNILMGDPTFNPNFKKPSLDETTVSFNKINNNKYSIIINFPEIKKDITTKFSESSWFNLPSSDIVAKLEENSFTIILPFNVPQGYNIKKINDVTYKDSQTTKSVKFMPVFHKESTTFYDPQGRPLKEFSYLLYFVDEGVGTHYFVMPVSYYEENHPKVIQPHQFIINLELEEATK